MSIWEQSHREGRSLNDIVSSFEAAGDASELVSALQREEDRLSALYVIAELPTALSRPIWRCALGHAAEANERTAFNALDIFHSFVREAEEDDLLVVLQSTNLESPGLFAKLFAIMLMAPDNLLRRSCDLAHERAAAAHAAGLALLVGDSPVPGAEVRRMLKSPNLVTRFYACCLIGRNHSQYRSLHRLLPARVRTRLQLHMEG
jgi:hypothetical protein